MYVSKISLKSNIGQKYSYVGLKDNDNKEIENPLTKQAVTIPSETFKAYNNIEDKKFKIDSLNIITTGDDNKPNIYIERITKEPVIPKNNGLVKVYELTLSNQFHDSKCFNTNSDDSFYEFNDYISYSKTFCDEENFTKTLGQIKKDFTPKVLDEKYIKEALELAPVALYIESKNAKIASPKPINVGENSLKDYKNLIKDITPKDVENYHKDLMKNSQYKLTLVMNEEFYKENKKDIDNTIIKNYEI